MAKKIQFTFQEARAICDGMNQQRLEKIQGKAFVSSDIADASLLYKEDFIMYETNNGNSILATSEGGQDDPICRDA